MENEVFMCFEVRNIQLNSFEKKLLELIVKPENLTKKHAKINLLSFGPPVILPSFEKFFFNI